MNIIYFDSSILIAEGWPRPSTELSNLLALARLQGVAAVLPVPVEQELEERWLREIEKTVKSAAGKVEDFNRQTRDVASTVSVQLPDATELRAKYRLKVDEVKRRFSLQTIHTSARPLEAVFKMALKLTPPFEEKGVGFKDSVILLSILDHLEANQDRQGALIVQDTIFANAPLVELSPTAGGRLQIFKELKGVQAILFENIARSYFEKWQEDRKNIKDILERKIDELDRFVRKNLEINRFDLPLNVVSISGIDIAGIIDEGIQAPIPRPENGKTVAISFELKAYLHVVARKFPEAETKPFKIGETPKVTGLINYAGPREVEEIEMKVLHVEALALFNNGYQDIQFTSVAIKGLGFGFGKQGLIGLGLGTA